MKCTCGANNFVATESWFLKGYFEGKKLFLKSTGGGDGIDEIECSECGEILEGDFEVEIL